jgi:hypothetical protein
LKSGCSSRRIGELLLQTPMNRSFSSRSTTMAILQNGNIVGAPIVLPGLARTAAAAAREKSALSSWLPVAGPKLFRHRNGRVWLDVLTTAAVSEEPKWPHLIVYQRTEVTSYFRSIRR